MKKLSFTLIELLVTIAQQKAYLSLQYTVAIKNAVLEAYKEIMNMQM